LEEKLYFKPANYGKGKKQQTEQRVEKDTERKSHRVFKLVCLLLFLLIIVLIIIWLLHGRTTTSGHYPEDIKNEALTCVATDLIPPKINSIDSENKEIKINAIFNGKDTLKNISLIYTLSYTDSNEAYGAEAKSHAEFNKSLVASGFTIDKFSSKFARFDNRLIISLTASSGEITEISAPYLMIAKNDNGKIKVGSIFELQKNYEAQGFSCTNTIK